MGAWHSRMPNGFSDIALPFETNCQPSITGLKHRSSGGYACRLKTGLWYLENARLFPQNTNFLISLTFQWMWGSGIVLLVVFSISGCLYLLYETNCQPSITGLKHRLSGRYACRLKTGLWYLKFPRLFLRITNFLISLTFQWMWGSGIVLLVVLSISGCLYLLPFRWEQILLPP